MFSFCSCPLISACTVAQLARHVSNTDKLLQLSGSTEIPQEVGGLNKLLLKISLRKALLNAARFFNVNATATRHGPCNESLQGGHMQSRKPYRAAPH